MSQPAMLKYNSFSLVYLQIFTVEEFNHAILDKKKFEPIPNSIDRQIFYSTNNADERAVERYRFKPFNFKLQLEDSKTRIEGCIFVEMSVFFNRTVSLSYRMVVNDKFCRSNQPLNTDELIALSALRIGAEHWNCDNEEEGEESCKTASNINLNISDIEVNEFHLNENGRWLDSPVKVPQNGCFEEIQERYKRFVLNSQEPQDSKLQNVGDLNYIFIDVWEDVGHSHKLFTGMTEPEIITHINTKHKQELIGLMSFYPYEWLYRTEECFEDVCGSNVAIDTDDLILLNQNICVVFGTYGLRGKNSPTDWKEHLEEREEYHVSWPEYLLILEMVLAKKYTLSVASDLYLQNTLKITSLKDMRTLIEQNSQNGLKITSILLQLDAIKYSRYISHKIMFERTTRRLEVEREKDRLEKTMNNIDAALVNISEMRKLRQSVILNVVLGIISVASLFEILFQSVEIPFLEALGMGEYAGHVGVFIVSLTFFLILVCLVGLIVLSSQNNKLKKNNKPKL